MNGLRKLRIGVARSDGTREWVDVQGDEFTTLVDALGEVSAGLEHPLVYRHSCHHGSCGTCGVVANGRPLLACTTTLDSLGPEVTVDPLPGFPVLADLAVDTSAVVEGFPRGSSTLRRSESAPNSEASPPPEIEEYVRLEDCIECGICVAACPVTSSFIGPAALAAFGREIENQADRASEVLERVSAPDGVPACLQSYECNRACPTGVFPGHQIAKLRKRIGL